MASFQNEIHIVEQPKNKPHKGKLKSSNGYGAIREKLDETKTLTVKQPVVNEKRKQKSVFVQFQLNIFYLYNRKY